MGGRRKQKKKKKVFFHVIGQVSASNYWQRQDLSVLLVVMTALTFNLVLKDHFDCPGGQYLWHYRCK